jgi:Protein of unknown function (DUF3017)
MRTAAVATGPAGVPTGPVGAPSPQELASPPRGPRREWAIGVVLAGVAVGLAVLALGYWRLGCVAMGVDMCCAGLLRAVVPPRELGLLVIRSRAVDALTMLGGGLVMVALVLVTPDLQL